MNKHHLGRIHLVKWCKKIVICGFSQPVSYNPVSYNPGYITPNYISWHFYKKLWSSLLKNIFFLAFYKGIIFLSVL